MKSKTINQWSRKELLSLPVRKWDDSSTYDSLLILPLGIKHDSNWGCVAIIGCNDMEPTELCVVSCDAIHFYRDGNLPSQGVMVPGREISIDSAMKSRATHIWSRPYRFHVGLALSDVDITFVGKAHGL